MVKGVFHMKKLSALALFAAAGVGMALSGCASDNAKAAREKNPAPCPIAVVLDDASRLIDFDGEKTAENIAWTAEIVGVTLNCRYYGDRPIKANLEIDLAFGRGPKAREQAREYSYFVAVTRTNREVIAKETFVVPVKFGGSKSVRELTEKIDKITIPRSREQVSGANFEVVIGLGLTREQAIYNRSGKSLKFPEL